MLPTPELDLQIAWLVQQGFPSFDEFRKDPDKYRNRPDELFEAVDGSTLTFREKLKAHKYMWKDVYLCESLEQVERICKEEGFSPLDLEMEPIAQPVNGTSQDGEVQIVVRFWPKDEFRARGGIVAND